MSGGRFDSGPAPALLGVEIGRTQVRLALLDPDGKVVDDAVEAPIVGGDIDEATAGPAISDALASAIGRLGLIPGTPVQVGATIGFSHCGVGSGPALRDWLVGLSRELREPVVHIGEHGVSYAPVRCLDFVDRVFRSASIRLDRVELAPVAASRTLGLLRSGALTLGSGVAWSARILDGEVMEALEVVDGAVDEVLHLVSGGTPRPVANLDGVFLDEGLCRSRGVSPASLAPAVGVALSLHDTPGRNLLDGRIIDATGPGPGTAAWPPVQQPPGAAHPPPRRPAGVAPAPDGLRARPAGPAAGREPRPEPTGARPPRPAPTEPANRLSATDVLIGALLMLTIVLVVALVVP